jgi:hypothetical protein
MLSHRSVVAQTSCRIVFLSCVIHFVGHAGRLQSCRELSLSQRSDPAQFLRIFVFHLLRALCVEWLIP